MIGVIDYGMGNLASVVNALEKLGVDARLLRTSAELGECERAILPGVGSFAQAMSNLRERGWFDAIRAHAESGRPLLGICLGLQLLFTRGAEHGPSEGLGLISGRVERMKPTSPARVPHVGWNTLIKANRHPIFEGVSFQADVYFVHSFHCLADDPADVIARVEHGGTWVAAAGRKNVVGLQFHPEKSQPSGLRMLDNFTQWDGTC